MALGQIEIQLPVNMVRVLDKILLEFVGGHPSRKHLWDSPFAFGCASHYLISPPSFDFHFPAFQVLAQLTPTIRSKSLQVALDYKIKVVGQNPGIEFLARWKPSSVLMYVHMARQGQFSQRDGKALSQTKVVGQSHEGSSVIRA